MKPKSYTAVFEIIRNKRQFNMENLARRQLEDKSNALGTRGTSTVSFNVGGRIYEVSRSLLEQYPDTMLARMASDMWMPVTNATTDGNKKRKKND